MQDADPMLRGLVGHAERQDRPTSQADDLAVRTNEDQLGAMHSQLPQAPQEKQAVLPELPPMPAGLLYKSHAQGFPCHEFPHKAFVTEFASQHAVSKQHWMMPLWSLGPYACVQLYALCLATGSTIF